MFFADVVVLGTSSSRKCCWRDALAGCAWAFDAVCGSYYTRNVSNHTALNIHYGSYDTDYALYDMNYTPKEANYAFFEAVDTILDMNYARLETNYAPLEMNYACYDTNYTPLEMNYAWYFAFKLGFDTDNAVLNVGYTSLVVFLAVFYDFNF